MQIVRISIQWLLTFWKFPEWHFWVSSTYVRELLSKHVRLFQWAAAHYLQQQATLVWLCASVGFIFYHFGLQDKFTYLFSLIQTQNVGGQAFRRSVKFCTYYIEGFILYFYIMLLFTPILHYISGENTSQHLLCRTGRVTSGCSSEVEITLYL